METKIFKNTEFVARDYEVTNVVYAVGTEAPSPEWIETDETIPKDMVRLWIQGGTQFYGWL